MGHTRRMDVALSTACATVDVHDAQVFVVGLLFLRSLLCSAPVICIAHLVSLCFINTMSWNDPSYGRIAQRAEEIPFSSNKQPLTTDAALNEGSFSEKDTRGPSQSRSVRTLLWEWKWELATWLLGTGALASLVVLLVVFQGRSLKEWTFGISLAAVVAVLSQVAQSALLVSVSSCIGQLKWDWLRSKRSASDLGKFEEASRGSQGSIMLLPKTKL
jgi:hypothetical protein